VWDGDRSDAALDPDPTGLHVADREVILDPVLIVERVDVDLGCARGDVVEQAAEAIGDRQSREASCLRPVAWSAESRSM